MRPATLGDAPALFDVHQASVRALCAGEYSAAHLAVWFDGRSPAMYGPALAAGRIWLAERDGRVLGFVGFAPGEVTLLFVHPQAAGVGLGKRLLAIGLARASTGIDAPITVVATLNSRSFYAAQGFTAVGTQVFERGQPAVRFPVVTMLRRPVAEQGTG